MQTTQMSHPTNTESVALITPEVIEAFQRDGVVLVRNALHSEWLSLIALGLARVLRSEGQGRIAYYRDEPGRFVETVRNFDVIPEVQRLIYDSPIVDMLGVLIGSDELWLYDDEFWVKGGGAGRTPWHQDLPYWPASDGKIGSMWISLDPLAEDECLEYVAGSHRGPLYDGLQTDAFAPNSARHRVGGDLPALPDIESDRSSWDIVRWAIEPGDVILAHPATLHGGGATLPESRRRTLAVRCFGDDVRYHQHPPERTTAPPTPGLGLQLAHGDLLRTPWYPQVKPRPAWSGWAK
jgi:ectoine hydroxylase-related dioxygenase (phytanoyl-CoA dioxygenase family)